MLCRALCVIALGTLSVVTVPVVYGEDKTPAAEKREAEARVQEGLQHFEAARLDLTAADPLYSGRRAQAIEQTDYAIEQAIVALGDTPNRDAGRLNWERIKKAAEDKARNTPAAKDPADARRVSNERMKSALNHLIEGHKVMKNLGTGDFGGHKAKSVYFAEEAIKDVRESLGLPREAK